MALDDNIVNNLFKQAGSVGASVVSSSITQSLNKNLFSRLGSNNVISVGGFLGSQTASLIKNFLFTTNGIIGNYDPVWKLTTQTYSDSTTPAGNLKQATPDDFAGADHPKYKFNFTVSFNFRNTILTKLLGLSNTFQDSLASQGADTMAAMAFGLKTASRPNPTVTYQDINFYNYRTKIATKVDYGTVTLTFYDDVNNRAHDIFAAYLRTISPIAGISDINAADIFDQYGITPEDFTSVPGAVSTNGSSTDVSSVGALNNSEGAGLIRNIILTQHLPIQYKQGANAENSAILSTNSSVVQYTFHNPRIINMNLDDLDMTTSDVSTVSLTFMYDAVYLNKVQSQSIDTVIVQSPASQSIFNNFLSSIDNAINPTLNSVNSATAALNASSNAQQIKSFTSGI